jgi:hypothetical protein
VKIELGDFESFGPVTQEIYRLHPATIHSKTDNSKSKAHGNFDCKALNRRPKTETCSTLLSAAGIQGSDASQADIRDATTCSCIRLD